MFFFSILFYKKFIYILAYTIAKNKAINDKITFIVFFDNPFGLKNNM